LQKREEFFAADGTNFTLVQGDRGQRVIGFDKRLESEQFSGEDGADDSLLAVFEGFDDLDQSGVEGENVGCCSTLEVENLAATVAGRPKDTA
jgi:hypothetical protein